MPKFAVTVAVTLKPEILDPAGEATQHVLRQLGYLVDNLRIGRHIALTVEADSADEARDRAQAMAEELLAHPVMERYAVEVAAL
jgi:phosphoribosylformylglycinamidine synthase